MFPSRAWSGVPSPLSYWAMMLSLVLHLAARSFWVIFGTISFLRFTMAGPTLGSRVLGLTMSLSRSTLVRCWPSVADFCKTEKVVSERQVYWAKMWQERELTLLAPPYFFSVPMMAPDRCAALMADLPFTTRSRSTPPLPGPRTLLPIRVTLSHPSSAMSESVIP
jgi:hypothetical protein